MEKNRLALFDLDGTLFDTKDVNFRAYSKALANCGIEANIDYNYYCKFCNGNSFRVFIPQIVSEISEERLYEVHQEKKRLYKDFLRYARKNEHLFSMIETMQNNYIIALVTTASRKNVEEILSEFNCQNKFNFIISQEDVNETKPSPECFIKAMKIAGIEAENTIIFEDSEPGIEAARASGAYYMKIYGYN